ncbi:Nn.00g087290.m01.CDS01 [Neocucurbitaria sp. VM-36]
MAVHERLAVVLAFVLTGISTIVVALRFYSRHFLVGKLSASDWVMFLALIAAWGSAVVNWYMIHFLDYSGVNSRETFAVVATGSLLMFWTYRLSYILDLCLIKTSILLFYCHIAASNKRFHYVVRALLTIILLGGASMIFAAIFTCYPISDAWSFEVFERGFYGIHATQCYNPGPFWLFNAAYNLVTDVLIWTLPIFFFLNLQTMALRRRLELVAIFSVGLLAIVASAVRLRIMVLWLSGFVNQGENTANLLIWSQVEQHTGIVAASIPFLRPIFRKALTKARSREQPSPSPVVRLVGEGSTPRNPGIIRTPIIPSPSPTFGDSDSEFRPPRASLAPIEPVHTASTWGSTIWDGTQFFFLIAAGTMNSTAILTPMAQDTYWGSFEEISKYNVSLNYFEKMWLAWYTWMGNDVLATGIMSFVIHETLYFGRSLPWIIIDTIPYFRRYKIQQHKIPTAWEQTQCALLVLLSHFTVELPQIWLFHPMCQYFGLETSVPFPSLYKMAYQIAIFFVMEDAWHYWTHRLMHASPFLYKNIHKIHHQYSAPFGLAAEYASPIEVMVLGFGTVGVPIMWCAITKDLHILTMYTWIVFRLFQAIDAHSGYEFPWSLHHFLPFWAGAEHHDVHHEKFIGNYASSFRWWDFVLDTEAGAEASKKRRERKLAKLRKAQ